MTSMIVEQNPAIASDIVASDWSIISTQLVNQWDKLTLSELEDTQHKRHLIARLIQAKYGVDVGLAENYLKNLERTLPQFS